jgi:rhodanese-related sulfurtransferase
MLPKGFLQYLQQTPTMSVINACKLILAIMMLAMSLQACTVSRVEGIKRYSNKAFEKRLTRKGYLLLDVRTPEEYDSAHLAKAILINLADSVNFNKRIDSLPKKGKYLIYCRSGKRSLTAARKMKAKGFKKLGDLETGLRKWTSPTLSATE